MKSKEFDSKLLKEDLEELSRVSEYLGYNKAISCIMKFKSRVIDHLRSLGNPMVGLKEQGYLEGMTDTFNNIINALEKDKPIQ